LTVIVIHAGMPKAGSSSIQEWLEANSATVREQGYTVSVAREGESGDPVFVPHEGGAVNSGWVVDRVVEMPATERREAVDVFVDALASCAEQYGNIVISGESFAQMFWSGSSPAFESLQRLSTLHEVRVAYYVRPQHASLEAEWRQWGFRGGEQPSTYIERCAGHLHYATTRSTAHALAPGMDFEPRPFRRDLIDSGDPVVDFAGRFLGVEVHEASRRANRGLPLEVVNILRAAPVGMFWDDAHDNGRIERIKQLLGGDLFPEDDRVALSRRVLGKYAFNRFAAENAELGWEDFVPLPDDEARIPGLEALDRLWAPTTSPGELFLLFRALQIAVSD
jgi:hypothetical protein